MRIPFVLLLVTACQQTPKTDPDRPAGASPLASSSTAPAASAAATRPWFLGGWQGAYQAELFQVVVSAGGVKDWKTDDGKQASGEGQLLLQAAADGSVTGTTTGALGELTVAGQIDGDRTTLTLTSARADGFHGVLLASRTAEGMSGTLSASTGDSLRVRHAKVTLTRVGQ